jgi:hypothetical protein
MQAAMITLDVIVTASVLAVVGGLAAVVEMLLPKLPLLLLLLLLLLLVLILFRMS